jgi:hypothetical protein
MCYEFRELGCEHLSYLSSNESLLNGVLGGCVDDRQVGVKILYLTVTTIDE